MRRFLRSLHLTRISFGVVAVLLLFAANPLAQGQQPPLVYTVENTGASFPTPVLPDFAHAPINRQLPDPFVFANGTRDTTWASEEQHRNEWMNAILQTEEGPKPSCTGTSADAVLGVPYICSETASYTMTSANHYTLTIVVTVAGGPTGPNTLTFTSAIVTPTPSATCVQPANGWPYVIGMGSATGSWPASAFNASVASPTGVTVAPTGCAATVVYSLNSIAAYTAGSLKVHNADPFYKLYPNLCAGLTTAGTAGACNAANGFPNGSNSAEYAAWSWGISRLIDAIQIVATQATNPLPLDTGHSAVTGCSYAGKMAMWGGALDERIALTISQENGGGGAPSWRISHEVETQGSVENVNDTDYDWFNSTLQKYTGAGVYKLPEDHFQLMALIAPRALLQTGDSNYYWLGDRSATFDSLATQAIYDNYGIDDRFNYYIDTVHFHCVVPAYQQNATQPIINRFMFGQNVATNVKVSEQFADVLQPGAQPTWDPKMWTAWWGTGNPPAFPPADVWNSGGDVMLPLSQNITVNTGDTITTSYGLTMPGTHGAATVTVPTAYSEVDIACTDGTSYTLVVPSPNSSGYQTNNQAFTIGPNDNTTFTSNVYSATNPGCSNGSPGQTTGTYFFGVGISNPGAGNPGLTGFSTTDGLQSAAITTPLNVTFNLADSNTGQGGTWAPWTTLNRQNPYSCTPPGCPLTPTITWPAPATMLADTPLTSAQLNATASSTLLSGFTGAGNTGLLTTASIPGTWSYSPAAGTVLSPGMNTLTATFTPTNLITSSTTAGNAYKTYTTATASVPIMVGTVTITATGVLSKVTGGYQMVVTVTNTGNVTAPSVQLTGATLGSASSTSIPESLGDIASGGSASVTLTFPASAGADGAGTVERLSGTYTGGSFGGSFRAVLP
jgi:hypothetical protein